MMVARIVAAYGKASAADLADGLSWYRRAQRAARELSPENPARAAGVIAALSPRTPWPVNLTWAAQVLAAADSGSECPAVNFTANRAKAWQIALGADPGAILGGPKVRAFYAAIMGDENAVTVDVWAARAAEGERNDVAPKGARIVAIIDAYRTAAAILGVSPRECQAAVWVYTRRTYPEPRRPRKAKT